MIDDADRRALATLVTWVLTLATCAILTAVVVAVAYRLFLIVSGV